MKQVTLKELAKEILKTNFICFYVRGMNDCKVVLNQTQSFENEEFGVFYLEKISASFTQDPIILYGNELLCDSLSLSPYETLEEQEDILFNSLYYYFYNENYMDSGINKEEPIFFKGENNECYDAYLNYHNSFMHCEHCSHCQTSLNGESCDLTSKKIQDVTTNSCMKWTKVNEDAYLEELWKELEDIPMNPETEELEENFHIWSIGTSKEDIWHWFDECHSKGIYYLLNKENNSTHKLGEFTGFKDCKGNPIYVGSKVKEYCNGLVGTVGWDNKKGTYKLMEYGDYYIEDSDIEWEVIH